MEEQQKHKEERMKRLTTLSCGLLLLVTSVMAAGQAEKVGSDEPIRIGIIGPFTGPSSVAGLEYK
jgi:hypothetical protein